MDFTLATRRLSAGTYLDSDFCQRVLLDAYADRSRYVAPSYGFDLAQVTFHARRSWWLDTTQHVLVASVVAVGLLRSPLALVVAGGVLMTWHLALTLGRLCGGIARYFREGPSIDRLSDFRLRLRLVLVEFTVAWSVLIVSAVVALGYESVASIWGNGPVAASVLDAIRQASFDLAAVALVVFLIAIVRQLLLGHMLQSGALTDDHLNNRMRCIAEQERSRVTYYADYRPFIGSGEELSTWNLNLRLLKKPDSAAGDDPGIPVAKRELDKIEFTTRKLTRKMKEQLHKLHADDNPEAELPGLNIADRVFVVGSEARSVPAEEQDAIHVARTNPTGPARHYLSCRVEAWDGEVVTNVFVHISLQGRVLYVEFSAWALLPTRPDFHIPDSGRALWRHVHSAGILRRLCYLPQEVRRVLPGLGTVAVFVARRLPAFWRHGPSRYARDPGTRFSVREDGSVSRYVAHIAALPATMLVAPSQRDVLLIEEADPQAERNALKALKDAERLSRQAAKAVNYFQVRDVIRHWRIIERRVLAALLDFLEEEGLDTGDYHSQASQIITTNFNFFAGPVDARGSVFGSGTMETSSGGTRS
ncbi:hypothetical protein [Dactylosporangium sp. NPDC051484]|uniref:hypothetical protein n=1 Tax=Dactylosporangium sp. NPDC051484 TaxID=3154942 RepID=UPI0034507309